MPDFNQMQRGRLAANYPNYICHHGIKGMKWGVRRTPAQLGHKASPKHRDATGRRDYASARIAYRRERRRKTMISVLQRIKSVIRTTPRNLSELKRITRPRWSELIRQQKLQQLFVRSVRFMLGILLAALLIMWVAPLLLRQFLLQTLQFGRLLLERRTPLLLG